MVALLAETASYAVPVNIVFGFIAALAIPAEDKARLLALMKREQYRQIPLVDATGRVVGLETLLAMILGLMMVAKFKSTVAEFVLVPFVSLVNIYMLRLIRDIDDPFDFAPDGSKRGGAEVDLFPITEYRSRLAARIG